MKSGSYQVGIGLARVCHAGMMELRRRGPRSTERRQRIAALPESLTVHARFALHRWHAVCREVRVNDYGTLRAAVYAAAQEAFARRLGEGVPLRHIHLSSTDDAHVYVARYSTEEGW